MGVFFAFIFLLGLTVSNDRRLTDIRSRSYEDWVVDSIGLFFQGILIPLLQVTVVYQLYQFLLPGDRGSLALHPLAAFCLSFVLVDYLYYWNHRLLHLGWFWRIHMVHHTMTKMHVLSTSRNTLWTSFLIVYLWIHALFIYLLLDPSWYIAGITLSSALDLWRHSSIAFPKGSWIEHCLSSVLILPQDHAWHHASGGDRGNYGANLKLWDRLHGTYYECDRLPKSFGVKTKLTLTQKLIWPF